MIDYFKILRPLNILITAFSAVVAYLIAVSSSSAKLDSFNFINLLLVVFSTSLTAGGGNVINDIFDIEIDMINKPQRPLPSGRIVLKNAVVYYLVLAMTAIGCGFFLGAHTLLACAVINVILFLYAAKLKRMPFWGNFTVAAVSGYLFYFCSITTGGALSVLPLALAAFFFHLIREVIKDAADEKGDRADGANTFIIRYGLKKTAILIKVLIIALVLFLLLLMIFSSYKIYFHLFIFFLIFPVLIYVFLSFSPNASHGNMEKLSKIMKYDMIFGVLAFYFGGM